MRYPDTFHVSTPGDREIEIRRSFAAPRSLVFDAFTKPELVRQWLLGPDGWTMPVCEIDLRVGGTYRYVWRKAGQKDMGLGGVFREVDRPSKIVNTEKFDDAWYPGEAVNVTLFTEKGARTEVTMTVAYESREARDTASRSGMERGMIAGFDRLENLMLATDEPSIVEVPARLAAAVHVTIPRNQIQSVMGPALMEVLGAVKEQGLNPSGAWFTHHHRVSPDVFDFDVCVPVPAAIQPVGRVETRDLPAIRAARTVYRGPYEGLGGAWGSFMQWIDSNGHAGADDFYECYAAGPETGAEPSEWRTEFLRPLKV